MTGPSSSGRAILKNEDGRYAADSGCYADRERRLRRARVPPHPSANEATDADDSRTDEEAARSASKPMPADRCGAASREPTIDLDTDRPRHRGPTIDLDTDADRPRHRGPTIDLDTDAEDTDIDTDEDDEDTDTDEDEDDEDDAHHSAASDGFGPSAIPRVKADSR